MSEWSLVPSGEKGVSSVPYNWRPPLPPTLTYRLLSLGRQQREDRGISSGSQPSVCVEAKPPPQRRPGLPTPQPSTAPGGQGHPAALRAPGPCLSCQAPSPPHAPASLHQPVHPCLTHVLIQDDNFQLEVSLVFHNLIVAAPP